MKYCSSCRSSYPLDYTACPKDQTPLELVTDLRAGMILRGKYEIVEKLGAGGMGSVYKAKHTAFGELRAIKFVSQHLLSDERALARFRAEAVLARRLQHPNAVRVEDIDTTDDGRPFIVMEYIDGKNLRDLFTAEGGLETKRVLALMRQTLAALGAAHTIGIVHRDIKPDNLMVVADASGRETVKVADFGLAKVREGFEQAGDKPFTQTGFILGTPPYMSPEQASGLQVDHRSDLYSLAIVLYELVTGRLPFRADTPLAMLMHQRETLPEAPTVLGVTTQLASLLTRALAKKREERYQTAAEMDEALRQLDAVPLPRFVGEGISGGFDPTWAGARHASRVTTVQATPLTKTLPASPPAAGRPGPPGNGTPSPLRSNNRFVVRTPEPEEPSSPSSRKAWIAAGALVVLATGWITTRTTSGPERASPGTAAQGAALPAALLPAAAASLPGPAADFPASSRSDVQIRFDIERAFDSSTAVNSANVKVEVANGIVTLSGEAPSEAVARLAITIAGDVAGVRQVFSTIGPTPPGPTPAIGIATNPPPAVPNPIERPQAPPRDDVGEQVRRLLERSRAKMEARNPEGAEADVLEALKLDPGNAHAREVLEHIRNRPSDPRGGPPPRPQPTR